VRFPFSVRQPLPSLKVEFWIRVASSNQGNLATDRRSEGYESFKAARAIRITAEIYSLPFNSSQVFAGIFTNHSYKITYQSSEKRKGLERVDSDVQNNI
jgi:hypothetical protein